MKELAVFNPASQDPFQMDLQGCDLSGLDLRTRVSDLLVAIFDIGKNPGLGVRSLHKRGITGRGVAIALVDNPLYEAHEEFAARLRKHERINAPAEQAHFHGSTVLSITGGETSGVAPGADLYFVSAWGFTDGQPDTTPRAKAFERVLEWNRALAEGKKIRMISVSVGWRSTQRGGAEMDAAAKRAKRRGAAGGELEYRGDARVQVPWAGAGAAGGPGFVRFVRAGDVLGEGVLRARRSRTGC
jgi:subtilisin family serine protease